jgi:hypothetical protein
MSPDVAFWLGLIVKMAVTAGFVVTATATAERAGALAGAMVATLPIAAGPAYVFVALDHDAGFIAASALSSLVINAMTAVFALTYAAMAQRLGLAPSLLTGLAVWVVLAAIVRTFDWTLTGAIVVNLLVIPVCVALGRRFRDVAMPLITRRWYDVPLRAGLAALLVATVVAASARVGPQITGILAVFPIVLSSLALILHPRIGGKPSAAVLANTISGLAGFSVCLIALHLGAVPLGSALGLTVALAVSIGANLLIFVARRRGWPI